MRDLEPLESFAIGFEGELATARLGPGRLDLFVRMRYALAEATFADGFFGGVADPSTGRVGYRMTDPAAAAELALRRTLPFAACGEDA